MLTESKKRLAIGLFNVGAIKFGAFRLKLHEKKPNAPLSPIYIDLRILRSFPEVMDYTIEVLEEIVGSIKFDVYADVPTAATPIVAILSYKRRLPMISPRKEVKQHGIKRPIDGAFEKGQIALLIDDIITGADSKLNAISSLEENGINVHDVVVLVDREQGGVKELERQGYSCHAAFKLKSLLQFYLENGYISSDQYDQTLNYLESSNN